MSKFEKGTSGNPTGRPSHNVTAAKLRELITLEDVQGILTSVIEQAKNGDIQAAKLILDKVLPSLKAIEVQSDLEPMAVKTLADFYTVASLTDEELERVIRGG